MYIGVLSRSDIGGRGGGREKWRPYCPKTFNDIRGKTDKDVHKIDNKMYMYFCAVALIFVELPKDFKAAVLFQWNEILV